MRVTFLGTRGNIDVRTRRHRRHTSTLVSHRGKHIMIDCGADWRRAVNRLSPAAIVLTHAHPDHVGGLRDGARCPVYAPPGVWRAIERWPIPERHCLKRRVPVAIHGITFEVFPLEHSVLAPAAGYRITHDSAAVFYAPDVLGIPHRNEALGGVTLYIGDGASIVRPIVRIEKTMGTAIGHAPIATQLEWCAQAGVRRAIFTHCGRAIVAAPPRIEARIRELGRAQHVETRVAHDGLRIRVR